MNELNKDYKRRDSIIFGRYCKELYKFGGIRHFEGLDVIRLKMLLDENFIDPGDRQNLAPSVKEIYEFMKMYPSYKAHGYAVSIDRDDYRVSIEGVEKGSPEDSLKEYIEYMQLFRYADEFNNGTMYCWFD